MKLRFNSKMVFFSLVVLAALCFYSCKHGTDEMMTDESDEGTDVMPVHTVTTDIVALKDGKVSGMVVDDNGIKVRLFKGIPYAAPPVGNLRWRPPQPVIPWSGIRDCTQYAPRAPQRAGGGMGVGGTISEDCLYLNVVTAAKAPTDRMPVMVFFHGGGLTSGTGNSPLYCNTALPRKGVVVVTVNSRLGPIGYMAHPALTAEAGRNASGNYGTLDLIASLKWVQENITAFGGNPGNVLIFGESGGGTKTLSCLTSPFAKGLFHKAVIESGSALISPERVTTLERGEAAGKRIVAKLGLEGEEDVLAALRALSWEKIIEAASDRKIRYMANLTVDGWVLPQSVYDTFKNGKQHDVPIIVGANEGEKGELQGTVPLLANLHSRTATSNAYVYVFSHMPTGWKNNGCVAFHGVELPYVFGYIPEGLSTPVVRALAMRSGCARVNPGPDEKDEVVAENAMKMWAQFARTGDPSVAGLITWPAYTESSDQYLDIDYTLKVKQGVKSAYVAPPER
jgi:para-nitrobenzyl esterase